MTHEKYQKILSGVFVCNLATLAERLKRSLAQLGLALGRHV